jgi:hypothetical protein
MYSSKPPLLQSVERVLWGALYDMATGVVQTLPRLITAFEAIQDLLEGSDSHQHLWFKGTSSVH